MDTASTLLLNRNELGIESSKTLYDYEFDYHINNLISFDFASIERQTRSDIGKSIIYNLKRYQSLLQTTFENAEYVENSKGNDVNWEKNEKTIDKLENKVKKLLGEDKSIPEVKPIIQSILDAARYYLIYRDRFPKSHTNPWWPLISIFSNYGLLFAISDDRNYLAETIKGRTRASIELYPKNIGIVVKGRVSGKSGFNGFVIDDRYSVQTIAFQFLKKEAYGYNNRKIQAEISEFLRSQNVEPRYCNQIQENVLTPLKKTGFIGSSGKGFFYISNRDDLLLSCEFHMGKIRSMERIVRRYSMRENEFNVNLDSECIERSKNYLDI